MGKITETRELYKETIDQITKDEDSWLSFLTTASWNFKYKFEDQILIYAQRPQATACAEMEEWNTKVKRWVNKDAKGIFVLAKEESKYPFRLIFDVSDTHNYRNTEYRLWGIKEEYKEDIIEALEDKFGEIPNKSQLAESIIVSAYNMVQDNIQDYMTSIEKYKEGSLLEKLSTNEINAKVYQIVVSSVAYMMLNRCGINPDLYISKSEYADIKQFNSRDIITILGTATSDIAEMGLREISKTVINLQNQEKKLNRTIVKEKKEEYSNNEENIKGGIENDRIHETRRLPNTKYDNETGENTSWKIRENEVTLLERKQESRIYNNENEQRVEQPLARNTRESDQDDRTNSTKNDKTRWSDGRNETTRPNEMDRSNEQLQIDSRGTNNERTNLQLDLLTEEEQKQKIAEVENTSAFKFTQEMIDNSLKRGSGVRYGKFRIYEQFTKCLSKEENAKFLKYEYGTGGTSEDENGISKWYDSTGITFTKGYEENAPILKLNWMNVEKRIRTLISLNRYLSDKEKERYENWKEENEKEETLNEEKIEEINEEKQEEYIYKNGDRVFLGTDEYEIVNVNEKQVTIADVKFPLFMKQIDFETFDSRAKDNSYNNHLKKSNRTDIEEIEEKKETTNYEEPKNDVVTKKQEENIIIPNIKRKKRNKIEYFDLHPEIPLEDRNNYIITDKKLGEGTPREKYQRNIEAIKVLKKCEEENRYATKEEQNILSQYVGWGSLQEAFDKNNSSWSKEYEELKRLLTEKEYKEARQSTLTAFYTPPIVIKSIYKALENMGLERGNILEPACGIGNFMGMLPENLKECKLYGVEIDSITGRIATQLYQKNTIAVKGYEDVELPDSFFDIAVGNVPFRRLQINR